MHHFSIFDRKLHKGQLKVAVDRTVDSGSKRSFSSMASEMGNDKENVSEVVNGGAGAIGANEVIEIEDDMDVDVDGMGMDDDDDDDEADVIDSPAASQPVAGQLPAADKYKELADRLMKPVPDYPVKDEVHSVWEIKDWTGLKDDKVRGPKFTCGGFEWNILLFPRGSNSNQLSLYIEPHPINPPADKHWYVCAKFGLDIWNPKDPTAHYSSGSYHRFNETETDWGFSSLIDARQLKSVLKNHKRPILENNQLNITAFVKVIDDSSTGVLWHSFADYDSKKSTGFVGLNNQGATCYLNSLLQSYFTTKIFRKLVYQIPIDKNQNFDSVAFSLQKIFYLLLNSNDPVGTLELTKSFGWDSSDAFTQHDVQELNRILMDKLETAMKATPIENGLNDIFVGKMKSYIKCCDVPYESSRVEDFWDIQLNVKGFKNLRDAFSNYIEIEMLEGENKYQAGDEYGYQDAKKGVVFESFPPVLHLQLKRFEYDFMVDDLVKIDDFYEFPDSIDLKPYLNEDLPAEIKDQNWNYKLHGVLVHQGSISNGHYYAMIKPYANKDTWLRFDDDKVWKVTPYQVFQENFGAQELSAQEFAKLSRVDQNENLIRRATSAYMLVYYRESELSDVLPDDDEAMNSIIPDTISNQIKNELKELQRIEEAKQEALYHLNIKFVTLKNFNNFNGFDLYPDPTIQKLYDESLFNEDSIPVTLKVKKEDSYLKLYELIGLQLGYFKDGFTIDTLDEDAFNSLPFRLVLINHRNNHTNRTDTPVPSDLIGSTINSIYLKCFNRKYDEMVFYVEEFNKDLSNINGLSNITPNPPEKFSFDKVFNKIDKVNDVQSTNCKFHDIFDQSSHMVLFLKYFDRISSDIKGLTHVTVLKDDIIDSLTKPINELMGFPETTKLNFFEELSPLKIENVDPSLTFEKQELSNGDIICIQVSDMGQIANNRKFADAREYYKFLSTRLHVQVMPFKAETDEEDSEFVADDSVNEENVNSQPRNTNGNSIKTSNTHKSFDTWISTQYSYDQLAKEFASQLGDNVDPAFLRIFIVNTQGVRYPLKTTNHLSQFFAKLVPVSQITTFEYEILNITLKEYENKKSIKIYWLNNMVQGQLFDFLIPRDGLIMDIMKKLINKVNIPSSQLNNILVWAGNDHKYTELIRFDRSIESVNDNLELYAGIFPVEVEILVNYDMIKSFNDKPIDLLDIDDEEIKLEISTARDFSKNLNMIPAFHFYKNSNYHHGIPFVFPVYPDENFIDTKKRLRKRLGLGSQAFEKIKFALADSNDKGCYIDHDNNDLILYDEIGKYENSVSLALDHPDRSPRKVSQFDKGISIK